MNDKEIKLKILELVVENMNPVAFDLNDSMNTDVDVIVEKVNKLYTLCIL